MTKVHRIAGLKISRVEPIDDIFMNEKEFWTPAESLPELEPPEDRLRAIKNQIFSSDKLTLSHTSSMEDVFDPNSRTEHRNVTSRVTVYVLNMILLVVSLPVGLAMLFFNILGGENLRTTAQVLALTGTFLALSQTSEGARLLGLI